MDELKRSVVYYPGCYVNFIDHQLGTHIKNILRRRGVGLVIPSFSCCGITLFYGGYISQFKARAAKLIEIIEPLIDEGLELITGCPSCNYALKEIYPSLLQTKQAEKIALKTVYISQYLSRLQQDNEFSGYLKKADISVAYHAPCHLKTQNLSVVSPGLLRSIPGLSIEIIDRGCCGMGGTWGLHSRRNNLISFRAGEQLFKAIASSGSQMVITDCYGCKIQITSQTNIDCIHPIELFASYDI